MTRSSAAIRGRAFPSLAEGMRDQRGHDRRYRHRRNKLEIKRLFRKRPAGKHGDAGRQALVCTLFEFMNGGGGVRRFRTAFAALTIVSIALIVPAAANDSTDCGTGDQAKLSDPNYFDVAIRACTRLIASQSGKSQSLAYRARAAWLTKSKKYDEALADLERAISIDPKNVEFYDYTADVWLAKGELDKAIAIYDRAIRLEPSYAAAHYSRGLAYEQKGDLNRARRDYEATLATPKTRPSDSTGIQEWAHASATKRLKALGKQDTPAK